MAVSKRGSGWIFNEVPQSVTKQNITRAKKAKALRALTEALEERQLMTVLPASVLPAPTYVQHGFVTGPTSDSTGATTAASSSPSIAYDPLNPQHLVSAQVSDDPAHPAGANNNQTVFVTLRYSTNGGATWSSVSVPTNIVDPVNSSPTSAIAYAQATDPTVAFDRLGNFYLSYIEHAAGVGSNSGTVMLQKYDWTGNTPTRTITNKVVYQWLGRDAAVSPSMAVDSNVQSFTDPDTGTQVVDNTIDPNTLQGPVYITWATSDANLPSPASLANFNANTIRIVASSDGGATFTPPQYVDTGTTNPRNAADPVHQTGSSIDDAHPKITISQGDPAGNVQPGQVNVVWDNFNSSGNIFDNIMFNSLSGGWSASATGTAAALPDGGQVQIPLQVNTTPGAFTVTDVSLQVAVHDASLSDVAMTLTSPSGTTVNLVPFATMTGSNLGVGPVGDVGVTFDDASIFPISINGVAYVGDFRPTQSMDSNTPQGFGGEDPSGTWTLTVKDSTGGNASSTDPQRVSLATLNLSLADTTNNLSLTQNGAPVIVANTTNLKGALGDSYPTKVPASPNFGVGPQPVIASDNTLGDYSPYAGRLYVAFVGRAGPGVLGDTDNTNIFLAYSDDGGASWSTTNNPVNDDNGFTDGHTGARNLAYGAPQFTPAISVDPNTGTLGMTWFDARDDAAHARVATYFATSIDGGQDFGTESYLNRPNEVFDAITGDATDLGPIPDNVNAGQVDHNYDFGNQMGLTMIGGQVHAVWAGNENGGTDGHRLMDIISANTTIADGPRIISSTMGVVGQDTDIVNPLTSAGPALQYIDVQFDRPVDISSFLASAVHVQYRGVNTAGTLSGSPDIPLDLTDPITALDPGYYGEAGTVLSATKFRIKLATPQTFVGTYTYSIDPVVSDGIRHYGLTNYSSEFTFTPAPAQQNVAAPAVNSNKATSSVVVSGLNPTDQIVDVNVNANIIGSGDPNSLLSVYLVGPNGVKIALSYQRFGPDENTSTFNNALTGNLSTGGNGFIGTTWDDQASMPDAFGRFQFSGTFRPEDDQSRATGGTAYTLAAFNGMLGSIANGTWKLEVDDIRTNDGTIHTATIQNWSLNIRTASVYTDQTQPALTGNMMDQNGDGRSGDASNSRSVGDEYAVPTPTSSTSYVSSGFYTPNYDSTTVPITVPGPHIITDPNYASGPVNIPLNDNTVNGGLTTSTITISGDPNAKVQQVMVSVDLAYPNTSDLVLTLVAPDGTPITLVNHRPATNAGVINFGNDLTPVVFSDQAVTLVSANNAYQTFTDSGNTSQQYVGYYQPEVPLSLLQGKNLNGNWTLQVTNTATGTTGTLKNWSLHITSNIVAVDTGVNSINVTFDRDMDINSFTADKILQIMGPAGPISLTGVTVNALSSRTFTIGFPTQYVSGDYNVTLASSITSIDNRPLDTNLNAGVDMLRDTSAATTIYTSTTGAGVTIPAATSTTPGIATSTITIPASDNFNIKGARVTLNLLYPNDSQLSAVLIAPDGTSVELFNNLTSTGKNFSTTIFDDKASLPIQSGSAPFNGTFNPQQPLTDTLLNKLASGTWTLLVRTDGANAGSIVSWSLSFDKPAPITGVGETSADQATANFRVLNVSNQLSQSAWTSIISGSTDNNASAGRVSSIAVDPSDPSGNTVYIGGAQGGVWKTTNFLTSDPAGPHWVPLTDFGPSSSLSIGGIAVFAQNNDVSQSVIFAATGEGDTQTSGVGFIRSTDGGATWTLLDSTNNNLPAAQRDHLFNSLVTGKTFTSYKIVVDPNPTSSGQQIVYAAISGDASVAGIWRSLDSGQTWTRMKAGQATDIILDLNSATYNAVSNPTKNVQAIYAAFAGDGVYRSPNRGQVWNEMIGGLGDPTFRDGQVGNDPAISVGSGATPNGANGRIVLAMPALTGNPIQDVLYEGWLYVAVVGADNGGGSGTPTYGTLDGLYMTKDFGQNWVKVDLNDRTGTADALPTNNTSQSSFSPTNGPGIPGGEGNFALSLAIDPNNPNVVYLGGTRYANFEAGLIRVDTTGISDAHALYQGESANDGGALRWTTSDVTDIKSSWQTNGASGLLNPFTDPTINLLEDPNRPFLQGPQMLFGGVASFANTGDNVKWIPFDVIDEDAAMTDYHRLVAIKDPITGQTRLIAGTGQGIFSVVDNGSGVTVTNQLDPLAIPGTSTVQQGLVTTNGLTNFAAAGARNGDLGIMQVVYGAVQPSNIAAQAAGAMFYVSTQGSGLGSSSADVLTSGNTTWTFSPIPGGDGGVATDQTGSGTHYDFANPFDNSVAQNFFEVNGIGRTFGLIQSSSSPGNTTLDAQWPDTVGSNIYWGANFAVNPLNGDQIVISSNAGRLFATENQGKFWSVIADPSNLDGSYVPTLTYGAPDPNGPGGISVTDYLIYAGTNNGNVFVTFHGGGVTANDWKNIGFFGAFSNQVTIGTGSTGTFTLSTTINGVTVTTAPIDDAATAADVSAALNAVPQIAALGSVTVTNNGGAFQFVLPPLAGHISAAVQPAAGGTASVTWSWNTIQMAIGSIIADPTPGSHDLYLVTKGDPTDGIQPGVYYLPDSQAAANGNPQWQDVTGNLLSLVKSSYGGTVFNDSAVTTLSSIQADWRYKIANDPLNPAAGTHPLLYVGGTGGVYSSVDNGTTWTMFPAGQTVTVNGSSVAIPDGGNLPNVTVTDLDLSLGNIDPVTGNPVVSTGPAVMMASTDGRGAFSIRIAPVVAGARLAGISDLGSSSTDGVTNDSTPYFSGYSAATIAGSDTVHITLLDANGNVIGGYDPLTNLSVTAASGLNVAGVLIDSTTGEYWNVTTQSFEAFNLGNALAGQYYIPMTEGTPGNYSGAVPSGLPSDDFTILYGDTVGGVLISSDTFSLGSTTDGTGFFQIQVKPGTFTTDGQQTVYIRATDDTGLTGAETPVTFQLDTTPPAAVAAPDLTDASDSGSSNTDNVTSVTLPTFQGAAGSVEAHATVYLYDMNTFTLLGQGQADATGAYSITLTTPLADGVYAVGAVQQDVAGNYGPLPTDTLTVTIDTTAPNAPSTPDLTAASDSGPVTPNVAPYDSDNITKINTPTFQGVAGSVEANATVNLYDVTDAQNPVLLGRAQADGSGAWTITSTQVLVDGDHLIAAQQTDLAGNTGPMSAALTVTIDTVGPVNPGNPTMTTDSGRSSTDNITNVNRPTFTGTGVEPFAYVEILNSNDPQNPVVLGSGFADSQGNYSITISQTLADGNYTITARQTDLAGNVSTFGFGRPGSIVIDGTDANDHGHRDSSTGLNANGWLYMQKVLENIAPNVGNGNKVLVALDATNPNPGTFASSDSAGTAGEAIDSAFLLSNLVAAGWTIVHVDGTANLQAYLAGQTVTGYDASGAAVTVNMSQTGILHITTVNNDTGDMPESDLQILNDNANVIRNFVNSGGGLYAMAETTSSFNIVPNGHGGFTITQTPGSIKPYGWLTTVIPGITVVDVQGSGGAIEITPEGQAAFPGLTPADLSTGPWHDYFTGNFGSLVTLASDLDSNGIRETLILTPGQTAQPLNITVDTTPPAVPTIAMSSNSDTGLSSSDGITQATEPSFGGQAEPNSIVNIYNGYDPLTRVLIGTVTTASNGVWAWTPSSPFVDGAYTLVVTATDVAGNTADPAVTPDPVNPNQGIIHVVIDNTAPAVTPYTIYKVEGQTQIATVGAFTDANATPSTAIIDWGDGSGTTIATISANGNGGWDIRGTHMYNLYGTYTTKMTVTDAAGNVTVATGSAVVSDPAVIATGGYNVNAVEGSTSTLQTVATFTDPGVPQPVGAYTATINWGDGSSSAGVISSSGVGSYTVAGGHNYAEEGSYSIVVTIQTGAAPNVTTSSSATVSDPAVQLYGNQTISAVEGTTSTLQTVATFTDPGGPEPVGDYAPLIDWGDGSPLDTSGQITLNATSGLYSVKGSHVYHTAGNYTVSVVVNHEQAPAASATSTASVSDAPLSLSNIPITPQEGTLFTQTIATLTDSNPFTTASEYTISINWGDGTPATTGTAVATNVPGQFNIVGSHAYGDGPSSYNISINVTTVHGSHITGGQHVNVVNVAPTPVLSGPVKHYEGNISFSVGASDPSSADRAAGFTYTINWGDGSPNLVIPATANNFNPQNVSHVFATDANYTVTVSITDKDGSTGSTTLSSLGPQSADLDPVQNLVINGGSVSRTTINTIDFTLYTPNDQIQSLSTSDLILLHNGSEVISLQNAQVTFDSQTGQVHLNLGNTSLADGQYQLQVDRGAAGVIPVNFSKLTGDVDGDGVVTKNDLKLIKANYGSSNSSYDVNGDGVVDKNDYNLVKKLVGRRTAPVSNRITLTAGKGISKPAIKFGNLKLGQSAAPVDLVVANSDPTQPLRIQDLKINGNDGVYDVEIVGDAWGQKPSEFVIPAGQTVTLRVFINPIITGSHNAHLSFIFSKDDHSLFNFADLPISGKVK